MRRPAGREFPQLGLRDRPPSPATRVRFFVTAPGARATFREGTAQAEGGPFHAKSMGTSLTACGMDSMSWKKLWDVPFSRAVGPLCQKCALASIHRWS